jgi:hypothetical protein
MTEANTIDHDWDRNSGDGDDPKSSATPIMWSVNVRDQEVVEMTHADLIERVRGGRLPVTTIIWRDGMDEWQALDHFPEFETLVNESRAGDSGLRAIPDEEEAPTSDNVGGPPTPRRLPPRQIQQTIPGIDEGATRAALRDEALDPLSGFGVLAVYERPIATLEFAPTAALNDDDDKPPASDALTPTNPTPLRRRSGPPLPARGLKESAKSAGLLRVPALPPLPPRPTPKPAAGRPATEPEPLRADEVTAAQPRVSSTSSSPDVTPAIGVAAASVSPPPAPASATPAEAASMQVAPAPDVPAPPAVIGPPRPDVASLPPIIVRELSVTELAATPAPVRHDEATLVLGRRKTHRWVPLRAAIVSAFGSACLASVLTWAIVRPARSTRAVEAEAKTATATRAPIVATDPVSVAATIAPPMLLAPEEAVAAPDTPVEAALPKAEASPEKSADERARAEEKSRKHSGEVRRAESAAASPVEASGLEREEKASAKPAASVAARPNPPLAPRAGWPSNPGF